MPRDGTPEIKLFSPAVPPGASVRLARLSPDGRRLAFARHDGEGAGIYVTSVLPGDERAAAPERVVALGPWRAEELTWAPDGSHIAYLLSSTDRFEMRRFVGWAKSAGPAAGEPLRLEGAGFAWTPSGKSLLLLDVANEVIVRHDMSSDRTAVLGAIKDEGSPRIPPRIVVSPDGARMAFTCRRKVEDVSEVWTISRESDMKPALITQVPGAEVHVLPFWSAKGVSLGIFMAHRTLETSGIVVVQDLKGEGELVYASERTDPPLTPAFTPSGRGIAMFQGDADRPEEARLVLRRPREEAETPISAQGLVPGEPRFMDDRTLVVDGGAAAATLAFSTPP